MFEARRIDIVRLALGAAMLAVPVSADGQTFRTLYSFRGPPDGIFPYGVVLDPTTGDLYGTTRGGGIGVTAPCPADSYGNVTDGIPFPGCGVVFKLSEGAKGGPWTETLLHSFTGDADGAYPATAPALNNGALYGTTQYGADSDGATCPGGCGTVFQFSLAGGTLQTIHTFSGGADTGNPYGGVVPGTSGVLYGTTEQQFGNPPNQSTSDLVYQLTPPSRSQTNWTFTALRPSSGGGDHEIRSSLVVDKQGNLYGMTKQAVLFELTAPTYAETTLYTFTNGAAGVDQSGLTIQFLADGAPILYGVTRQGGGPSNAGTVFKFDPATLTLTTLHTFTGGADGASPFAPVVVDANGVLYGTTFTGGNLTNCPAVGGFPPGCGTVFKLDPATQTLTTLHTFTGADGWGGGGVALDANGALYGTTLLGGDLKNCPGAGGFPPGCGTVFEIAAALTVAPATGQAPLTVAFKASGLTLPMTYTIAFGDGTKGALTQNSCSAMPPASGQGGIQCTASASHTYTSPGTYTASLLDASGDTLGGVTVTAGGARVARPFVSSTATPPQASPQVPTSTPPPERLSPDQH